MQNKLSKLAIIISSIAILMSATTMYTTVKASSTIQSKGKIVYSQDGQEFILDSNDFQVLQDEIDNINLLLDSNLESMELLTHGSTEQTVNIKNINNYKMLYVSIYDTQNHIMINGETVPVVVLKGLKNSNVYNYLSFYESLNTRGYLTYKLESDESINLKLSYGETYIDGRLEYYIYGIK